MGKRNKKVAPGMLWSGIIGIQADSYEGLKRCAEPVFCGFKVEDMSA